MGSDDLLTLKNPLFANYVFYSTVVLLKMFFLAGYTSRERLTRKIFANQEDVDGFTDNKSGTQKIKLDDVGVERIRRNHLNDLENIPAFIILGFLYLFTDPSPATAIWHFRIFAISRILHTISYQVPLPQPSRAGCYITGLGVCLSMAFQIISKTYRM